MNVGKRFMQTKTPVILPYTDRLEKTPKINFIPNLYTTFIHLYFSFLRL